MMAWVLRAIIVLVIAIGVVIATAPLSLIAQQAQARLPGVYWTQVQGTLWQGRISGLGYGEQYIGDARLALRPSSLLSGQIAYDVQLSGAAINGRTDVFAARNVIGVRALNLVADARQLVGLNDAVRTAGGVARLRDVNMQFDGVLCTHGAGNLSTDTLVALGRNYNEALPELAGTLACEDGMITLSLLGGQSDTIAVSVDGIAGLVSPSRLEARVTGARGEMALALDALGFFMESGEHVYIHETSLVGGSP